MKHETVSNEKKIIGPTVAEPLSKTVWHKKSDSSSGGSSAADARSFKAFLNMKHQTGIRRSMKSPSIGYPATNNPVELASSPKMRNVKKWKYKKNR
mmetsp:Transcript_29395/g.55507  ORF Transcript_29395/g.55507 Transcript_29395/m.55507 type:complete len:96 (+) Transcript_29395:488-775(+)